MLAFPLSNIPQGTVLGQSQVGCTDASIFSLPRANEEGGGGKHARELLDTEYLQYSLIVSKMKSQHRPAEDPEYLFTTPLRDCSAKPCTKSVVGRAVLPLKHARYSLCNCLCVSLKNHTWYFNSHLLAHIAYFSSFYMILNHSCFH